MTTHPRPAVFREAARRVAEGEDSFCCNAIYAVAQRSGSPESLLLNEYFSQPRIFWWGLSFTPQDQTARVLALLLCEQIAKERRRGTR